MLTLFFCKYCSLLDELRIEYLIKIYKLWTLKF